MQYDLTTYKTITENYPLYKETKARALQILSERSLSSMMNDTKWIELLNAIPTLPFPPAFTFKTIFEKEEQGHLEEYPSVLCEWTPWYLEGIPDFFTIEYLKVSPLYSEFKGHLVAPEIHDSSNEIEAMLLRLKIPFYKDNGLFVIQCYR